MIHSASESAAWTFFDCVSESLPRLSSSISTAAPKIAIVAGSIPICRCSMNPAMTSAITDSDCLSSRRSVIDWLSLKLITCRRFSSVATRWRPQT